jgi:hypothetical protein
MNSTVTRGRWPDEVMEEKHSHLNEYAYICIYFNLLLATISETSITSVPDIKWQFSILVLPGNELCKQRGRCSRCHLVSYSFCFILLLFAYAHDVIIDVTKNTEQTATRCCVNFILQLGNLNILHTFDNIHIPSFRSILF